VDTEENIEIHETRLYLAEIGTEYLPNTSLKLLDITIQKMHCAYLTSLVVL